MKYYDSARAGTGIGKLYERPFHQESGDGCRKDEVRPLVSDSALCTFPCFDTDSEDRKDIWPIQTPEIVSRTDGGGFEVELECGPMPNVMAAEYRWHPLFPLNFWTLWCNGRLTEADTPTIRLGATPSRLTSAHLHHCPPALFLQAGCAFCRPTNSVKALKATSAFGLGRRR